MTQRKLAHLLGTLLLLLLVGCGSGEGPAETTAAPPETMASPVEAMPAFADGNGETWRIVRAENAGEKEIDAAVSLMRTIEAKTGALLRLETDFIKSDMTYDSSTYEILVGRTAHPASGDTLAALSAGQYTVRAVGRKLVVTAWTDNGLALAASRLCEMIEGGLTTYTADCDLTESFNAMLDRMPVYTDGKFAVIANAGQKAYQMVIEKTTAEAWEAYCAGIAAAGFALSSTREAEGNRFAVYRDDAYGITTYFTPFNKTARTIIEPLENLGSAEDDVGTPVCTPLMTMIGRRYSQGNTYRGVSVDTGYMCYLIRLTDGRFIVVDGGTESGDFSGAIYRMLIEQAPDSGKLTIAAWIITHTHGDHTGAFRSFCKTYSKHVTVEQLIHNFPADGDANVYRQTDGGVNVPTQVISAYTTSYPRGEVIKAHNGYTRNIGGAEIEVLYTHEDLLTSGRSLSGYTRHGWNKTSLIFRMTLGGETIMFLGDAQEENNDIAASMYGDYLQANIVQAAHHGGEGGTARIYTHIDPKVALFTTSDEIMPLYLSDAHNAHLVGELNLVEWVNAADRITCFKLPYTPGTAEIIAG